MNELEKAEDRLKDYGTPFSDDSFDLAREIVMARTIYTEKAEAHSEGFQFSRFYAAAAGLAFILSLPFAIHFIGKTSITAHEKSEMHLLPDGSEILLAKGSTISYNSILWSFTRKAKLRGEGFFTVKSGGRFTVETALGDVSVLGTQFSVWEKRDALLVQCQEGKVDVEGEILEADEYIILSSENATRGKWTNSHPFISKNESDLSFDNTPIQVVIEALKDKFGTNISFTSKKVYRFSGSLNENDLENSLTILTKPFGLKIASEKGGVVILEPS